MLHFRTLYWHNLSWWHLALTQWLLSNLWEKNSEPYWACLLIHSPLTQSKRKFIRRELSIIWQLFDADSEKLAGRIFKLPIKRFLRSLKRQNIEKLSENVLNHAGRVPGKEVSACRSSANHRRCCLWRRRLEPVVRRCCLWWCCGEPGLHAGGEPDSVVSDG